MATGSDSSVESRDEYERSFGALLILIIGCAAFETAAYVMPSFHTGHAQLWSKLQGHGLQAFAITAGLVILVGGANEALFKESGLGKKVGMLLVGILGMLIPLLVVLSVADFLIFRPPTEVQTVYTFRGIQLAFLWLVAALVVGSLSLAFSVL